jgi:UDP-2,4-diacetamido-2,4,6-trideoxy-beta-L-altropyranose hydrolase
MTSAVFRCDASPTIGAGHVMRCLAFAEALRMVGFRVVFAVRPGTAAGVPALAAADVVIVELAGAVVDEPTALSAVAPQGCDVLVVDHYERDVSFERGCRSFANCIIAFDDGTGRTHDCDILLDTGASDPASYRERVPAMAKILTGPQFALLRRAIVERRQASLARRTAAPVDNVLVSFGATDPSNVTAIVLDALHDMNLPLTVALSAVAPHLDSVKARMPGRCRLEIEADMVALIANADIAIGAAGSSAFERACLGLPSIIVSVAGNQQGIARLLTECGAALDAGTLDDGLAARLVNLLWALQADSRARLDMTRTASALVDGRGALRLLAAMAGGVATRENTKAELQLVEASDEQWLLDLQRQPGTRRFARNPALPSPDEHHVWLNRTLNDPNRILMLIRTETQPAGMIRLDRVGPAAFEVSIAIDENLHGRGIGSAGLALVRRFAPGADLIATVLPENRASLALFSAAGYRAESSDRYRSRAA